MATDTYFDNVSLLLHMEGSDEGTSFTDSGPIGHTVTANGGANTEADQAKWGSTSGEFPVGSGSYLSVADHASLEFGSGDFTIEGWIYPGTDTSGTLIIASKGNPTNQRGYQIRLNSGSAVDLRFNASSTGASYDVANLVSIGSMTTSTWNHFAVTRSGNTFRTYLGGSKTSEFTSSASLLDDAVALEIGGWSSKGFGGYIDDLRITKGVARYTGESYTVPSEAFPDSGPISPDTYALTATGLAPEISVILDVGAGSLAFTGTTSEIDKFLPVGAGAATLSGPAPSVFVTLLVSPGAGAATLAGAAPEVGISYWLDVGAGSIVSAGAAPGTLVPALVEAGVPDALITTTYAPVASVVEYGGDVTFEELTLEAYVTNSLVLGAGVFEDMSAAATVVNGGAVFGNASFESLTCVAYDDARGSAALKALTAQATAVPGRVPRGAATFKALTLQAAAIQSGVAYGSPLLRPLTAQATAEGESLISAAATFAALQASGAVASGGAASAAAAFEALVAEATAYGGTDAVASTSFAPLAMDAIAEAAITSALNTWVMNTRTRGLTRYPSYPANSFARYNGTYLAAGPSGLLDMQGADSDGVAWEYEVGDHDEQTQRLKRCSSVLFDLFYENPVTVTVKKDGNTSFAYPLPNYRPSVLHQVRVVPGKGLRGRHFQVGAKGTGRFEVHSMIVTMPNTSRRIG